MWPRRAAGLERDPCIISVSFTIDPPGNAAIPPASGPGQGLECHPPGTERILNVRGSVPGGQTLNLPFILARTGFVRRKRRSFGGIVDRARDIYVRNLQGPRKIKARSELLGKKMRVWSLGRDASGLSLIHISEPTRRT